MLYHFVPLQYRTTKNYRNGEFLGPRIGDKIIFSIIIFTLWWKVGECMPPGWQSARVDFMRAAFNIARHAALRSVCFQLAVGAGIHLDDLDLMRRSASRGLF